MILCGNKCDLSDARVISKERGLLLAEEYDMKFTETSAYTSINVEEVLTVLLFNDVHYAALSMYGLIVRQVVHISRVIWIAFCVTLADGSG